MQKSIALAAGVATLALLGGLGYLAFAPSGADAFADCRTSRIAGDGGEIGAADFTLTSETGARMSRAEVIDGLTLIYFGYTYCPDICPTDAARNAEIVTAMAAKGVAIKPVFITIDPERDSPEALATFTDLIHPDMLGLTGSEAELAALRKSFLAYAAKNGTGESYLMDHSTYSYLMTPEHGLLDLVRHEATAEDVLPALSCFAERLAKSG